MQEGRQSGHVEVFNRAPSFGFIRPDDGGAGLFVHSSNIKSEDHF
jgi:cold shock CspA family protein